MYFVLDSAYLFSLYSTLFKSQAMQGGFFKLKLHPVLKSFHLHSGIEKQVDVMFKISVILFLYASHTKYRIFFCKVKVTSQRTKYVASIILYVDVSLGHRHPTITQHRLNLSFLLGSHYN